MSQNPVEVYVSNYLEPRLNALTDNPDAVSLVVQDIKNRLAAIITRWNDEEFRRTLLVTGFEEASFYQPASDIETRALVVLAVRNSKLEDLGSTEQAARTLGLSSPVIFDDDIPGFTQEAIAYFSQYQPGELAGEIPCESYDPYQMLSIRFPVAWQALSHLGWWERVESTYDPVLEPASPELNFLPDQTWDQDIQPFVGEIQSGLNPAFTPGLLGILGQIQIGKLQLFYVDSFKSLTRHPEKLFKTLEWVLRAGVPVITANFYLENGYVARRQTLVRPQHCKEDTFANLKNLDGLTAGHREMLIRVAKNTIDATGE
ncbi:MAG TPA: hypothetical protein VF531_13930 [Bacillota bacterium]